MKKFTLFFLCALLIAAAALMASCEKDDNDSSQPQESQQSQGTSSPQQETPKNVKEIFDAVMESDLIAKTGNVFSSYSEEFGEFMDEDMISGKYGEIGSAPDFTIFKQYVCYFTMNYYDEIVIFEVADSKNIETAKTILENRVSMLKSYSTNYPTIDVSIINGTVVDSVGNYVYMVSTENNHEIVAIIKDKLK